MINVLINATTIVGDKDTHSAIEFIQAAESKSAPRITWHYAVSRTVARGLLAIGPNLRSAYFFEHSPANSKGPRVWALWLLALACSTDLDSEQAEQLATVRSRIAQGLLL